MVRSCPGQSSWFDSKWGWVSLQGLLFNIFRHWLKNQICDIQKDFYLESLEIAQNSSSPKTKTFISGQNLISLEPGLKKPMFGARSKKTYVWITSLDQIKNVEKLTLVSWFYFFVWRFLALSLQRPPSPLNSSVMSDGWQMFSPYQVSLYVKIKIDLDKDTQLNNIKVYREKLHKAISFRMSKFYPWKSIFC